MEYRVACKEDIDLLMQIRLEMLRIVNNLEDTYLFDEKMLDSVKNYFLHGHQTTILAFDGGYVVGCASVSYIDIMPTFSHPTGKRAHLMNVYTKESYRGQGIGQNLVELLIKDAKDKGATEISLDATEMGRPLYEKIGFTASEECMTMNI